MWSYIFYFFVCKCFRVVKLRKLLFVWVTEHFYVSIFFTCFIVCVQSMLIRYRRIWWLINKNVIFLLSSLHFACQLVLYLYACTVENPKISGFCVSEIRGLHTEEDEIVFLCNVDKSYIFLSSLFLCLFLSTSSSVCL